MAVSILKRVIRRILPAPPVVEEPPAPEHEVIGVRERISFEYIHACGIEIGALHGPLPVSADAKVTYVDRMSVEDLRAQYPEMDPYPLVAVDIVDDGETLKQIPDASCDFVIANHLIEHCEDPILAMENWLRVLKSGGILYLAVPDKRYTFDLPRELTDIEHLTNDHANGPEVSRRHHFEEWARYINKTPEEEIESQVGKLLDMNYSIHYHVWDPPAFLKFLLFCQSNSTYAFEIEMVRQNESEIINVIRKCG